jgi:hypothetical protein
MLELTPSLQVSLLPMLPLPSMSSPLSLLLVVLLLLLLLKNERLR